MEKRQRRILCRSAFTAFPAGYPPFLLITFNHCRQGSTARRSRTTERSESVSEEAEHHLPAEIVHGHAAAPFPCQNKSLFITGGTVLT